MRGGGQAGPVYFGAPAPTCDGGGPGPGRGQCDMRSHVIRAAESSGGDTPCHTIRCQQRAPGLFTGSMQMSRPSNTVR